MPVGIPETGGTTPFFDSETSTARRRTITGLSLMVVAFVLNWIPYVNYLGELLALIGIIFLILGRWGFDLQHHSFVVGGAVLLLILLIAGFIAGIAFVASVAGDAQSSMTASQLSSTLQGQVDAFFVATMVLGSISGFAYLLMPYGLADRWTRTILWVAFVAQVLVSVVVLAVLLPITNSAISQATSGTTFDAGPINGLESTALVLGMTGILPSLLFAWGYYRVRSIALERD
jgi:hypothetical protein